MVCDSTTRIAAEVRSGSLEPLFDTIINHVPAPKADPDAPFTMLVSLLANGEGTDAGTLARAQRTNRQTGSREQKGPQR